MRRAQALALVGTLLVGACGGGEQSDPEPRAESEQVEIITKVSAHTNRRPDAINWAKSMAGTTRLPRSRRPDHSRHLHPRWSHVASGVLSTPFSDAMWARGLLLTMIER